MGEKQSRKEDRDSREDKESYSRKFFENGSMLVTDREIRQNKYEGHRKIYIDNVAGVTFNDASLYRIMSVVMFAAGLIIGVLLYFGDYDKLYLAFSLFICVLSVIFFVTSKDKLVIQSNASVLHISHTFGFRESHDELLKAIDDSIKMSRK